MCFNYRAKPSSNTDYSCHIKAVELVYQLCGVHIMPLITRTRTYTHTHTHTIDHWSQPSFNDASQRWGYSILLPSSRMGGGATMSGQILTSPKRTMAGVANKLFTHTHACTHAHTHTHTHTHTHMANLQIYTIHVHISIYLITMHLLVLSSLNVQN